jgi:hypothetical protein
MSYRLDSVSVSNKKKKGSEENVNNASRDFQESGSDLRKQNRTAGVTSGHSDCWDLYNRNIMISSVKVYMDLPVV